jgi:hypothetical protein
MSSHRLPPMATNGRKFAVGHEKISILDTVTQWAGLVHGL